MQWCEHYFHSSFGMSVSISTRVPWSESLQYTPLAGQLAGLGYVELSLQQPHCTAFVTSLSGVFHQVVNDVFSCGGLFMVILSNILVYFKYCFMFEVYFLACHSEARVLLFYARLKNGFIFINLASEQVSILISVRNL